MQKKKKRRNLNEIVELFNKKFGTDYVLFKGSISVGETCVWLGNPKWVSLIQQLDESLLEIYKGSYMDFIRIEDEFERLVDYHVIFPRTLMKLASEYIFEHEIK